MVVLAAVTASASAAGSTATPTIVGAPEVGKALTAEPGGGELRWQRCVDAPYAPEVLRDDPAAYYRLGDPAGEIAITDASGGESVGRAGAGVNLEAEGGPFEDTDGAAELTGADGVIEIPAGGALDVGDAFTLEVWVKTATGSGSLVDKGPGAYRLSLDEGLVVLARNGVPVAGQPGQVDPAPLATSTGSVPADGAFHHVVAVKDGASIALYVDGVEGARDVAAAELVDTDRPLLLGGMEEGGHGPVGTIDEVALYRGALSPDRIREHYDVGSAGCSSIEGAESGSYVVAPADHGAALRVLATPEGGAPTVSAPTEPVSTDVPLNLEPPVVWGEAFVGRRLPAGQGAWAGLEPISYDYRWQSCLDGRYAATVLSDSPNAYWRLGERSGTTAKDASGKGNRGTYVSGVKLGVPGALGGSGDANTAAGLDGRNDHVTAPDRASLDLGDSLTIELWIRRTAAGVAGQLVHKGLGGYSLRIAADDRLILAKANGSDIVVSKVAIPADGAYRYVVATKNGSTAKIYVDGVDVTRPIANATIGNTSASLELGRFLNPSTGKGVRHFRGDLDEVAVYDHALTPARVRAHHQAGTSACASIAGAVGDAYTPTSADAGKRLRVVVTARNAAGSTTAISELTAAPVGPALDPVIAAGRLTDAGGKPLAGAAVSLYLWPAGDGDVPAGAAAPSPIVAQTVADAGGNYALRSAVTPQIQAAADANGGVVNFEVRAVAGGLVYESFVEREFAAPAAESLALGGDSLEEAGAIWQDPVTDLPTGPLPIALDEQEPGVAAVAVDPPGGGGVECSTWDQMFMIWKKTGRSEAYVRVGELHTWSTMRNRFEYGTRSDTSIGIAFKTPGRKWYPSGSVFIGRTTSRSTAAGQEATTGPGEYTSRAVKARFIFSHWYQCGTGNKKIRADRWNGANLAKGGWVSSRDGECSALVYEVFDPEQDITRDRHKAVRWGAGANLGVLVVTARSGFSSWAKSQWWFGKTLASRTLCGVKKGPLEAQRVFAGW